MASSNFLARISSLCVSWKKESSNLFSRFLRWSSRMLCACVKSTSGPGFTWASCESTAPKIGSITSFAWQHGQVTFRFSPSFRPMAVFYSYSPKKVGGTMLRAPGVTQFLELRPQNALRLRGRISSRETRRRPQLGPHHLRIGTWRRLWRRRRWRSDFLRERFALHKHFHFVGVEDFAFQQCRRD